MDAAETCEVIPTGYLTGTLAPAQVHALALSGAIPAAYVRERASAVLGVAAVTAAVLAYPVAYALNMLTHLI